MPWVMAVFFATAGIVMLGQPGWEYVGAAWIASAVIWLVAAVREG